MEAMKNIGIRKVAFSDENGRIRVERVRHLTTRGATKTQLRWESGDYS
jgi:hypothetical protein